MKLSNGWSQIDSTDGCKDYRRIYNDSLKIGMISIRLWQTVDVWNIEVSCNPFAKGIEVNHPIVFLHKPTSKDEISMMNEADDLAREDFTRLYEYLKLAIDCMEDN